MKQWQVFRSLCSTAVILLSWRDSGAAGVRNSPRRTNPLCGIGRLIRQTAVLNRFLPVRVWIRALNTRFGYYHGNRNVVRDWQHDHLSQPSYGYEWVQDGDQFVLIAIATGIITDVILNAMNQ